ncbi:MAG TPA: hypothetical protein VK174_07930 [Chitinophagales bacterium]|nr:hypothetical protein [Chitinophagales bacterium]
MKKIIFYTLTFIVLSVASSCKCEKCKHAYLSDTKVCRDNFDNNEDYRNAIEINENIGYTCTPSN